MYDLYLVSNKLSVNPLEEIGGVLSSFTKYSFISSPKCIVTLLVVLIKVLLFVGTK